MWKLVLAFTIIPLIESYLLIEVGSYFGPLATVGMILLTGVFGGWMAKREGTQVMRDLIADLQKGLPPAERLAEGALVLVGAVLLICPGVLTDLTGILLVFPPTRRFLAPRVLAYLASKFKFDRFEVGNRVDPAPHREQHTPFDHPVR